MFPEMQLAGKAIGGQDLSSGLKEIVMAACDGRKGKKTWLSSPAIKNPDRTSRE